MTFRSNSKLVAISAVQLICLLPIGARELFVIAGSTGAAQNATL